MVVLWEYYGNGMVAEWECRGNTMCMPWDHYGNTMGILLGYYGNTMELRWEYYRNTMRTPWEYVRNTMGEQREHYGNNITMEKLWYNWGEHRRNGMRIAREYFGKPVKILRSYGGCTMINWWNHCRNILWSRGMGILWKSLGSMPKMLWEYFLFRMNSQKIQQPSLIS